MPAHEVLSLDSSGELPAAVESISLDEILVSDAERLRWANSVRHQVSRQLLFLRRAQGLKQRQVATKAGASQPQIARIESGEENITLDTLEKLVNALRGRFIVSIPPDHLPIVVGWAAWWKAVPLSPSTEWKPVFTAVHKDGNRALVGLMRSGTEPQILLEENVA